MTALQMSIFKQPALTRTLLEAGAIADDAFQNQSPLVLAACNGNADAVDALLKAGAPLDARDARGRTPRQCAEDASRQPDHPPLFPERQPFAKDFPRVLSLLDSAAAKKQK
jgi:ankyrin repeat protein